MLRRLAKRPCTLSLLASYMRIKKDLVQRSLETLEKRGLVTTTKDGGTTIWRTTGAVEATVDAEPSVESRATSSLGRRKLTERDLDEDEDAARAQLIGTDQRSRPSAW